MAVKKRGFNAIISLFLVISIFILMLLSGCTARKDTDKVSDSTIYSGTKGLEMSFTNSLPPSKIYDESKLTILAEIKNKGVSDLSGSKCFLHLRGYDPNIIRGMSEKKYCGNNLWEKSTGLPEGGIDTVEFSTDRITLPNGVDSLPQTMVLTACYEYETLASPVVCINPQLYKISGVKDACTVQDVVVSGGQGAPVAVTKVDVNMISSDKVNFNIYVSNSGTGTVLRPGTSLSNCLSLDQFEDFNVMDYSVKMSSGSMVKCSPDDLRLTNGKAVIYCTFRVSEDYAYTTPLQIKLDYNYMDTISKKVEIVKTPE